MQPSALLLALVAGASASSLLPRVTDSKLLTISELTIQAYAKSGILEYFLKVDDGINPEAECRVMPVSPRDDTSCHNSPEINGFSRTNCSTDDYAWSIIHLSDGSYDLVMVNVVDQGQTELQGIANLPADKFQCLEGPEDNYVKSYNRGPAGNFSLEVHN